MSQPHQNVFHEELEFLLQQFRDGHVKNVKDLMSLIDMAYSDYLEFHPEEIPEYYEYRERKSATTPANPV